MILMMPIKGKEWCNHWSLFLLYLKIVIYYDIVTIVEPQEKGAC